MFETYSDIVTPKELCEMLNISPKKVYELLKTNQIPSRRIGRVYRIQKNSVIHYMNATQ